MLQTHVNNDIYNKYCLIHNTDKLRIKRMLAKVLPFAYVVSGYTKVRKGLLFAKRTFISTKRTYVTINEKNVVISMNWN